MKLKDLNKGQKLLIELAKKGNIPKRLNEQLKAAFEGKINPLLNEDGDSRGFTIVDDTYDGPEDKTTIYEFNPDNAISRVMAFFVNKFGSFGAIYFECIRLFDIYPKKKAKAKFRYFLGMFSKEQRWYRPSDKKRI